MGKLSVILYISIGVALLFFLSRSPKHHDNHHHDAEHHDNHHHDADHHDDPHVTQHYERRGGGASIRRYGHGGHRRLKVKSNFTFTPQDHIEHHPDPHHPDYRHGHGHHEPVAFDPVVAEIERHREDKEWERMYFDEHHKDIAQVARAADAALNEHHGHGHGEEHHGYDATHHDHDHGHEDDEHGHHYEQHHGGHHEKEHHHDDHHGHHDEHHEAAPGHEHQPEWEDFMDAEDFLNDEEKFNVTNRLVLLFPKIDLDPKDGFVSEKELVDWHLLQAEKEVLHRTEREMDLHDKNKDGNVSFSEYEPPSWVKSSDNTSLGYDIGWWKEEHFNASDLNGDGLLNITEFNDFLHPADTKNPKLLQWLCKEEIRERDTDKDGKVNFTEFFHGLFDLVRNYEEDGYNSTHPHEAHNSTHYSDDSEKPAAKKLFNQLDKDGDGLLTDTELLPIIDKLHPPERYYAKQQADYIIAQADTDKDGRLSLAEMIENPYVFYSTVFSDEDEEYDYHDELR